MFFLCETLGLFRLNSSAAIYCRRKDLFEIFPIYSCQQLFANAVETECTAPVSLSTSTFPLCLVVPIPCSVTSKTTKVILFTDQVLSLDQNLTLSSYNCQCVANV